MENMKILYVVSLYPCWSETFIVREINTLIKRGHTVYIASLKHDCEEFAHPDALQNKDRVIYPSGTAKQLLALTKVFFQNPFRLTELLLSSIAKFWNKPEPLFKTFASLARAASMVEVIKPLDIQHIHAHWATYPSTASVLLSDVLHTPFSFTSHAHDIFVEDQLIKYKVDRCKFACTISHHNVRWLASKYGADSSKVHVVHCGIDLEQMRSFGEVERNTSILAVGRFDEIKGFKYLIEAIGILKSEYPDIHCELVGAVDGDTLTPLQARISELGIEENIDLLGAQSQDVVVEKMKSCGVFVLPCVVGSDGNMDGIPVVLMEAMALGTPVVSTGISGIPELIEHEKNGILVEPNDPLSLARGIKCTLSGKNLDERVKAARERITNEFNIEHEVSKLETLFRDSIGSCD